MPNRKVRTSRYFVNDLPDYVAGTEVTVPYPFVRTQVKKLTARILDRLHASVNNCDGGLYVGVAGVAYALYRLLATGQSGLDLDRAQVSAYVEGAKKYLSFSLKNLDQNLGRRPGSAFILGNGGVNAVAASFYTFLAAMAERDGAAPTPIAPETSLQYIEVSAQCLRNYASAADDLTQVDSMDCGSDELFVGRAGYLCGLYYLEKQFKQNIVSDDVIKNILTAMLTSGRQYSAKHRLKFPLMYAYHETEYLGAAHGLCSILQMMLNYIRILEEIPNAVADVRKSIDALMELQWDDGNFPPSLGEKSVKPDDTHELVHWCHGAPGVVYLMAKAYLVFNDDSRYLECALRCGEVTWTKGLLKKGPGLCHGIAGNAYVFLTLYKLLNYTQPKWLHRAVQFAHFIFSAEFQEGSRTPDCPYSLYEGVAGTVCFLADLLDPKKASFPFFDIFD